MKLDTLSWRTYVTSSVSESTRLSLFIQDKIGEILLQQYENKVFIFINFDLIFICQQILAQILFRLKHINIV